MMSFCVVPWRTLAVDAVLLADRHVEREQPRGRGVDRHRRVHLVQRDAVEERVHVALVGDRDADLADLAARELVVGVVAGLGGQVERDREAGLALLEVLAVELVRLPRGGVPRVGAHHPRPVRLVEPVVHALNCMVRPPFGPSDRRQAPGPRAGHLRLRSRRLDRGSGPDDLARRAARGPRRRAAARPAPDPHPPRPRGRDGRAGAPLPRSPGLRARARRAAPGGPVEAARQREAGVRRGDGHALGRVRRRARGQHPAARRVASGSRASASSTRPATRSTT